jgi:hypothetical protein
MTTLVAESAPARPSHSPVVSPGSGATGDVTASSAATAASLVASPPRRTRRR